MMSKTGKKVVLIFAAVVLFVGVLAGEISFSRRVVKTKNRMDGLRKEEILLEHQVDEKTRQIMIYRKAIAELEKYRLGVPEDDVDFYSRIEQELTRNGVSSKKIRPVKATKKERSSVEVNFEGSYYAFLETLADWRSMDVVVRVSRLSVSAARDGNAKGKTVLESVLMNGGN